MLLTQRYRVKDATTGKRLLAHARSVTFVWNYCCDVQRQAQRYHRCWPSAFDLIRLTTGAAKDLGLHSDTVSATCRQFVVSRTAKRRCPKWRSQRVSLGWVPLIGRAIQIDGDTVRYVGRRFRLWLSRPINAPVRHGSFSQDARGRWYLNLVVEVTEGEPSGAGAVGIDLGLKTLAVLSTGERIEHPRLTREHAVALARAQRANRRNRARAIHAHIANRRRHLLHQHSALLVSRFAQIVVGNVCASACAKTRLAKSVYDASWATFRHQLRYKAMRHGVRYEEVDERFTTRDCSACGVRGGPQGIAGLGMRDWTCQSCGVVHDRDLNAARNIPSRAGTSASC